MNKLMITLAATAAAVAGVATIPAPALAQQASGDVAEIIVYGNDPCPRSTDDQVVVCARHPEAERYRIPQKLRESGTRQQTQAWAKNARAIESAGASGINSCSPVGPAGTTGCLQQVIREAREQRKQTNEDNKPPEE